MNGGDLGGGAGQGFYWWMVNTVPRPHLADLPSGIVICLKHSENQKNVYVPHDPLAAGDITVVDGDYDLSLRKENGGDRNGHAGQGFY